MGVSILYSVTKACKHTFLYIIKGHCANPGGGITHPHTGAWGVGCHVNNGGKGCAHLHTVPQKYSCHICSSVFFKIFFHIIYAFDFGIAKAYYYIPCLYTCIFGGAGVSCGSFNVRKPNHHNSVAEHFYPKRYACNRHLAYVRCRNIDFPQGDNTKQLCRIFKGL